MKSTHILVYYIIDVSIIFLFEDFGLKDYFEDIKAIIMPKASYYNK